MIKIKIRPPGTLSVFGDSFSNGYGASVPEKCFTHLLAASLDMPLQSYAVNGHGSFVATKQAFIAGARVNGLYTWMASFNDILHGTASSQVLRKIQGELRAFLANAFLASAVAAEDAAISKTGSWSNLDAGIEPKSILGLSGNGLISGTAGNSLSWTFSGDSLVIGCYNADGVNERSGAFTVVVDGVTVETYNGDGCADGVSDGTYWNRLTHEARVYKGFGAGSHTVVVTVQSAVFTPSTRIDYFGTLAKPHQCLPVFVAESPYVGEDGWLSFQPSTPWSPFFVETTSRALRDVCNEFIGYPVVTVRVNDYYGKIGVSSDNIHPSDCGYRCIYKAYKSAVKRMVGALQ